MPRQDRKPEYSSETIPAGFCILQQLSLQLVLLFFISALYGLYCSIFLCALLLPKPEPAAPVPFIKLSGRHS